MAVNGGSARIMLGFFVAVSELSEGGGRMWPPGRQLPMYALCGKTALS